MNSKIKFKTIIIITSGILLVILPLIIIDLSSNKADINRSWEYFEEFNLDIKNFKSSKVSGRIHINNNWSAAASLGICTGDGNYSNPYVIENLIIDAGGSGSCIRIENSDIYFRIENCTLYNSELSHPNAGIRLYNVDNGMLIDNNCSSNNYGIYFLSSDNNTLLGNTVANNRVYGIDIRYGSNNNNLSENSIVNNIDDGIHFYECDNNTVAGNTINNNSHGIYSYSCNNLNLTGNIIINNTGDGIHFTHSDDNNVERNTIINNDGDGIHFYADYYSGCDNNTVLGNNITNSFYGIYLSGAINLLSGNRMNGCGLHIYTSWEDMDSHNIDTSNLVNERTLYYYVDEDNLRLSDFFNAGQVILVKCRWSTLSQLNVSNTSTGISLYYSDNNIISENIANNNHDNGIYLFNCYNTYILANNISNNHNGLNLDNCRGFTISGNIVNNNEQYGIILDSNSYPIQELGYISENNVSYNYYGINLYNFQNVHISENNIHNNYYGIYFGGWNEENKVLENVISFNYYGIWLYGDKNTISKNIINSNEIGINLRNAYSNSIKNNTIINNNIGIDIFSSSCNKISDNFFSGNNIDIQGTQFPCNPFPFQIIIPLVLTFLFIAMLIGGRMIIRKRRSITKTEIDYPKKLRKTFQLKEIPYRELYYMEEDVEILPEQEAIERIPEEQVEEVEVLREEIEIIPLEEQPEEVELLHEEIEIIPPEEQQEKVEILYKEVEVFPLGEQPEVIIPSEPKIIICPFCGLEISENAIFCSQCGMKFKKK
ncbi:MAG: right-handed parallel beta-helix repeat-containing protein [Promethearchaeota archaeon]